MSNPQSIHHLRQNRAENGPYTMIIVKGQARGAKCVRYRILDGDLKVWGNLNNHQQAVDLVIELNDEYVLYCMTRGTKAEHYHEDRKEDQT